ncbi:MAG TPA: hypothetical protein VHB73_01820 [Alphaproteobacteria bacterium]|nr:hypothetical protein [Alphaproteobacteria bacterium]
MRKSLIRGAAFALTTLVAASAASSARAQQFERHTIYPTVTGENIAPLTVETTGTKLEGKVCIYSVYGHAKTALREATINFLVGGDPIEGKIEFRSRSNLTAVLVKGDKITPYENVNDARKDHPSKKFIANARAIAQKVAQAFCGQKKPQTEAKQQEARKPGRPVALSPVSPGNKMWSVRQG